MSIKPPPWLMRSSYINVTGQKQRKKGAELLQNGLFKEEFAAFLMQEVRREHFAAVIQNKTVYVSHGGNCVKLWVNYVGVLEWEELEDYQGYHEEADTLLIFHATTLSGNILVRSSDTDVLVLLVSLAKNKTESNFVMDYGSGNTRRYIDASSIARALESKHPGLCDALVPFHALTGCDFTSAIYRKGKSLPFSKLEKDPEAIDALRTLCTKNVNKTAITEYICRIYGYKHLDNIDEARYQSFIKMTTGKITEKVKKINCASLPPCQKTLEQHILRANYISVLWSRAGTSNPTSGIHPLSNGWVDINGHFLPFWFEGHSLPSSLTVFQTENGNESEIEEDQLCENEETTESEDKRYDDECRSDIELNVDSDNQWTSDSESWSDDDNDDAHNFSLI